MTIKSLLLRLIKRRRAVCVSCQNSIDAPCDNCDRPMEFAIIVNGAAICGECHLSRLLTLASAHHVYGRQRQ